MDTNDVSEYCNFSPEGRLHQIEYALQAIEIGCTTIGIKSDKGIVIVTEKKINSDLIENRNFENLINLSKSVVCCASGLTSDSRVCIQKIRNFLTNNSFLFKETISIEKCAKKIGCLILNVSPGENKEFHINRPLGVAFLLCGIDHTGIHLFSIDSTGSSDERQIVSLGNGSQDAILITREGFRKKMSLTENKNLAIKSMKMITENKTILKNIELCLLEKKSEKFSFFQIN
ncbi:26S proteasome SU A5 (nucleomorph) [Cryptomonas paramecium]|uniref:26S proteasome SU A5 n=1 Tax=Cryptomonas paramaecium TaxID=2898 RepID=F2HH80_9CRYP|nr:26S proteasome SU A5 [Cryptomonas paramecium]AEA38676.1 26S proteasome SU A5 [Cryptomonas paramecium]|mmetsp:Transcript_52166/g.136371  ORF Transcript_52166/g.136371 Transcript_52166/m.136371 type:complete len:231 (+) Transcript_52166:325-1017(+)